jgi:DNA-binding beta-propeller fold protein YncE
MKSTRLLFVVAVLLAAMSLPLYGQVPLTDNMPAVGVLGQTNFTTAPITAAPTASVLNTPKGIAIDPTTGKLFVADYENRRVLRWSSADKMINGSAAEAVLGQPDFVTATAGTSSTKMARPYGIYVDAAGRLWVSDLSNNRVLRFDNASTIASGSPASRVLGQADFVTGTVNAGGISASTMSAPLGVFVDGGGRLWVAERDNKRVLRFDNAASKSNGDPADGVLGEPNFTTNTGGLSASLITRAYGVQVDAGGRLWVADRDNNRVLRFDSAATKANGASASGVIGQTDFVTAIAARTQSGIEGPRGVFVDGLGKLYVSDEGNNRITIYNNAATKANGASADNVLGQANFTSALNASPPTASSLNYAEFMVVDNVNKDIWIADEFNHRILRLNQGSATAVNEPATLVVKDFRLDQNYPNPFNPSTTIRFYVPATGTVSLAVFDMLGREVVRLVDGVMQAGTHSVQLNGSGLSSGIYFYRLTGATASEVRKMILMK